MTAISSITWLARTEAGKDLTFLDHSLGLGSMTYSGKYARDTVAQTSKLAQKCFGN